MRFCCLLSCLALCVAPLAAQPFHSGAMRLRPAASIRLVPRAADFLSRLCEGGGEIKTAMDKSSPRCCGKVSNKPSCSVETVLPEFAVAALRSTEDGTLRASLFARTFELPGEEPLVTPCGRWTYSLRLDRRVLQPVSAMTLRPATRAALAGTFSGAFPLRAQLEFIKAGSGRRVLVPVTVRLDLSGTWTVAAESAVPEAPADSRLLLSIANAKGVVTPEGAEK